MKINYSISSRPEVENLTDKAINGPPYYLQLQTIFFILATRYFLKLYKIQSSF